jgi:hypothetical protein
MNETWEERGWMNKIELTWEELFIIFPVHEIVLKSQKYGMCVWERKAASGITYKIVQCL